MWYVVVLLACGFWGNCWAMEDEISVSRHGLGMVKINGKERDDSWERGFNLAMKYHTLMHSHLTIMKGLEEQQDDAKKDEYQKKIKLHEACMQYLSKPTQVFAFGKDRRVDSRLLYPFNNSLIVIDHDILRDPYVVSLPKESDRFTHYSACLIQIVAMDQSHKIHAWDLARKHTEITPETGFKLENNCNTVFALECLDYEHNILFFNDKNDVARAGFLCMQGYSRSWSFIPFPFSNVGRITAKRDIKKARLVGSIYIEDPRTIVEIAKKGYRLCDPEPTASIFKQDPHLILTQSECSLQ